MKHVEIEEELKKLIENRKVESEPKTGSYSWILFAKSRKAIGSQQAYKFIHTGRIDTYLNKIKKNSEFSFDDSFYIKVWDGADYVFKALKRIFKENCLNKKLKGINWYGLTSKDIEWLREIKVCKSFSLESEVVSLFDFNTIASAKKEGLN